MAESISIKERILRQVRTNLATVTGIGTVRRWIAKGTYTAVPLDGFVLEEDDVAAEGPQGNIGYTDKTLSLIAGVVLFADESTAETDSTTRNRWQARLEESLVADPNLVEAVTGEPLIIDLAITVIDGPEFAEGSVSAAVRCAITYRHDRDSPYVLGTLITEQTE